MELTINNLKIGDHVKVKKGIKAPDFEYQMMDGWQGEVIDIQKEDGMVEIAWDAETLMNTPEKYLKDIICEGYDHLAMTLEISEVEKADKRDNLAQRNEIKEILEAKIYWLELYEDEQKSARYGKLFQGVKRNDEDQQYQIWEEYLSENLQFAVETEVVESEKESAMEQRSSCWI